MNTRYDSFPEALKDIISEYGKDVFLDVRLANILADVYHSNDIPALLIIMKNLLSNGLGTEIIKASENDSWDIKFKLLESRISSKNGIKDELSSYIFESLAYGLNLTDKKPKYIEEQKQFSMYDMELELRHLKSEYLKSLEEMIEVPEEGLGFYSVENKTELYEIKEKIIMLAKLFNKDEGEWCDSSLNSMREKYSVNPIKKIIEEKSRGFFSRWFR